MNSQPPPLHSSSMVISEGDSSSDQPPLQVVNPTPPAPRTMDKAEVKKLIQRIVRDDEVMEIVQSSARLVVVGGGGNNDINLSLSNTNPTSPAPRMGKADLKKLVQRSVRDNLMMQIVQSSLSSDTNLGIDGGKDAERRDDTISHGTSTQAATLMANDPNYVLLDTLDDDDLELIVNELKRKIKDLRERTRNKDLELKLNNETPCPCLLEGEIKKTWKLFKIFKMMLKRKRGDDNVNRAAAAAADTTDTQPNVFRESLHTDQVHAEPGTTFSLPQVAGQHVEESCLDCNLVVFSRPLDRVL